jgi:hypothetical protein
MNKDHIQRYNAGWRVKYRAHSKETLRNRSAEEAYLEHVGLHRHEFRVKTLTEQINL